MPGHRKQPSLCRRSSIPLPNTGSRLQPIEQVTNVRLQNQMVYKKGREHLLCSAPLWSSTAKEAVWKAVGNVSVSVHPALGI